MKKSLHAFIKEELIDRIKTGVYKVGDQFPTENELCKEFNVSRTTVRMALTQLVQEGYLIRQRGKGSFVAEPKVNQTLSNTDDRFTQQLQAQGRKGKITLQKIEVVPAKDTQQKRFNIPENAPIQKIKRTRSANDEVTQYEVACVPWDVAPGLTKEQLENSLYSTLKDTYNISIHKTTEIVEITLADKDISHYLECEVGLPCFYIETVAEDKDGRVIEFSRSYFRGDKTSFRIERFYQDN
ncbi:GntR family transcriptional regulator [Alkalibacterium putridalgicola]|uniref:GntR family transcriptional regulator n=1 Tax=Alkalibacterium putridalgicola TaxID=426703 RepID=A0A1H7V2K2_9LACT|nr:GntR family transcriptional regulator [Alkalibacterium putridalgicola]GEK89676.1 putative HTH-type transcriptional regulator YbgA [Alkalibacterium putridalgicola]SEM03269.1 GntR family transcriptional regulator [Alkalibacterium putridalgicola]